MHPCFGRRPHPSDNENSKFFQLFFLSERKTRARLKSGLQLEIRGIDALKSTLHKESLAHKPCDSERHA